MICLEGEPGLRQEVTLNSMGAKLDALYAAALEAQRVCVHPDLVADADRVFGPVDTMLTRWAELVSDQEEAKHR